MKYDGFRYDYCKGFHNSHINDYNSAAKTYFSVMEYWDAMPAYWTTVSKMRATTR